MRNRIATRRSDDAVTPRRVRPRPRPPTLIATGRGDVVFPEPSRRAFLQEVPDASFRSLDTGHLARATHVEEIAALMLDLFDRVTSRV